MRTEAEIRHMIDTLQNIAGLKLKKPLLYDEVQINIQFLEWVLGEREEFDYAAKKLKQLENTPWWKVWA